jgi:hypothetical protein
MGADTLFSTGVSPATHFPRCCYVQREASPASANDHQGLQDLILLPLVLSTLPCSFSAERTADTGTPAPLAGQCLTLWPVVKRGPNTSCIPETCLTFSNTCYIKEAKYETKKKKIVFGRLMGDQSARRFSSMF